MYLIQRFLTTFYLKRLNFWSEWWYLEAQHRLFSSSFSTAHKYCLTEAEIHQCVTQQVFDSTVKTEYHCLRQGDRDNNLPSFIFYVWIPEVEWWCPCFQRPLHTDSRVISQNTKSNLWSQLIFPIITEVDYCHKIRVPAVKHRLHFDQQMAVKGFPCGSFS